MPCVGLRMIADNPIRVCPYPALFYGNLSTD